MTDASDEKAVKDAKSAAGRRAKADEGVLQTLLSSADGRSWLWRKLASCHIFSSSFDNDPYNTAFREGERNIGLQLLAELVRSSPESYTLMMKEANDANA